MSYQVPEFGPFKIAMVAASPFPYPQGSQVLIQQLAVALQCREHQVRLVTYHCGVGQPSQEIKVHRIRAAPGLNAIRAGPSWQKPFLDLLLARKLLQVVRNWQPDVMHAHNFEGLLTALFVRRLTGVPVLYHVHNAMGLELHTYFRHRLGRWAGGVVGRWVDANLPRRANYCIVLNKAAVGYFRQRGVEQLRAIPPGIDFEPGDATQARQYLGSGPLVLYAGNLDHYQDLDLLLRAFQKVIAVRPDAQLVFSTNAEPAEWQAQTRALGIDGQTVFVRASDFSTVRDLLAAADVSVCPRQVCLGFPIKLLNYMAAGTAIVASAGSAYGLRHLENGWIVEDGDVEGMAVAIVTLLNDPGLARRLGQKAQCTARHKYTWEQVVGAIEEVYAQVTELSSGRKRTNG